MHDTPLVEITSVLLLTLLGGLAFVRLNQPPILGYILAGVILGPSGFAFVENRDSVVDMAELGVLLLLFMVGMELNLRTFKKAWVATTLCTLLQIVLSLLISFILGPFFGWSVGLSILLGFVLSLSSTAVVVNMLERIGEFKSDAGQFAIGVLIAQDLAIIPMILILKNLDSGNILNPALFLKLFLSIGMIAFLIYYLSQRQRVRIPLTQLISGEKDLIPLASLGFCLAAAAVSDLFGLSAAYGAFLAGLVLGNTHERLILLETTHPIQSTLLMMFFLSVGLLFDIRFILEHWLMLLILMFVITVGKTAMNIGILHILRLPWTQSFLVGVVLSQLGEFAFMLATVGSHFKIIDDYGHRLIISLTVLSLAFSPLWLSSAKRLKDGTRTTNNGAFALLSLTLGPHFKLLRRWVGPWLNSKKPKAHSNNEPSPPSTAVPVPTEDE